MRNSVDCFLQDQAFIWNCREQSTSAIFQHNGFVVECLIEAEQRQFESVLSAGLAMATARIAAIATEERHDVVAKIDARRFWGTKRVKYVSTVIVFLIAIYQGIHIPRSL